MLTRLTLAVLLLGALSGRVGAVAEDELAVGFRTPPDANRPSCFWWWFNCLVDKEAITRDLEEFKSKGLGGVMLICSGNDYGVAPMPSGPVFLSPEWRELYKHAVQECARLGLELGVNFCGGGWCMGGSWIKPEYSSRWYVQSQVVVEGPRRFSERLPLPGHRDGYEPPYHGNVGHYITWPKEKADYRDTAVVAFREADGGASDLGPERRKQLPAKSNRWDGGFNTSSATLQKETLSVWSAMPGDRPLGPAEVIDLTATLGPDGSLNWDVPAGRWTIQRLGHVVMGCDVRCVLPEVGYVLEVDWLNPEAVDEMFAHLGKVLLEDAGPHVGKTLRFLHTDSFEDGYPNWTGRLLDKFQQYRGYDPKPYLPVLAGKIVGSAEIADRFLYDYRKTVADCLADGNYGHFAARCAEHGLESQCEAGGPAWSGTVCMDALKNLGRCDRPMGEFWTGGLNVSKQTASASHIYGRRTASAEAFTGFAHWREAPSHLKPIADRAFCDGINRFLFHTMTCQRTQDGQPGYEYGAGTHFNPNVTWWQQAARPWLSYVSRCQAMLQSGLFVADVLYYYGDWAPNRVDPVQDASLKGYDYDVRNSEVLLTRLSVRAGKLVLPDGMSYRLLVLPSSRTMPVEIVRRLNELVEAGATVIGPRPESDPGLRDYPRCDEVVRQTAAKLWGNLDGTTLTVRSVGKGRIVWGQIPRAVLDADGVAPDLAASGAIEFIHRATAEAEIYFVANGSAKPEQVNAVFRVSGRQPELWDGVTGTQRDLPQFEQLDGRTAVPLEFEPYGSMFVVFSRIGNPPQPGGRRNFAAPTTVQEITGPWTVQFDPQWFYPTEGLSGDQVTGSVVFEKLEDWSTRSEPAIRNFSGTAVYRKGFTWSGDAASRRSLLLDLGTVKETARVTLNGKDVGVVWCHPWRVEITEAVKPGENVLEIEVVSLWPNRLIGDNHLRTEQRRTRTNVPTDRRQPLLPSGLLGPVRVLAAE